MKARSKWFNCCNGPECGNRKLQRRGTVKVQPFIQDGMGWGLRVLEDVKAGELIREYNGQVLTQSMLDERMQAHSQANPGDHNMYVMELTTGLYLDARERGNVSRFINHSCGPNCELQKWVVQGVTRIGIFAMRDIGAMEALSYDYQFDTHEHQRFQCHCGAPNCRGSLSSKGLNGDGAADSPCDRKRKFSRDERKKLLKRARQLEKREQEKLEDDRLKRRRQLSHTSHLLPGDPIQAVRAGPLRRYLDFGRNHNLFLRRAATRGADFYARMQILQHQSKIQAAAAAAANTV